jgi:hypothetical protein
MNAWDAVGFLASGLVITAFCMKDIVQLRIVAVASNMAFLTYGIALGLMPVWLLHLLLLPVNLGRLWQMSRRIASYPTHDTRPRQRPPERTTCFGAATASSSMCKASVRDADAEGQRRMARSTAITPDANVRFRDGRMTA